MYLITSKNDSSKVIDFFEENISNNNNLRFESRFESGNLSIASKVSDNEYNLLLQNDINTIGNTQ